MNKQQNAKAEHFQFFSQEPTVGSEVLTPNGETVEAQTFSGIAYHGGLIKNHWYWGDLVFDLDGVQFAKSVIPSLLEHDRGQRCGIVTSFNVDSSGLTVNGKFLDNSHGQAVYLSLIHI